MQTDVEKIIQEKVSALPPDKKQIVLDFVEELTNGTTPETIWERLQRHLLTVPEEELAVMPSDASVNLDHYLYGAPKK